MTKRLEEAFVEAPKLPQQEQDALADWLFEELASEKRWDQLFAESQDLLAKLGKEAIAQHRAGWTQGFNPDPL